MTITEFLTARYDEDEAVARESIIDASRWSVFAVDKYFGQVDSDDGAVASSVDLKDAEHIARWDPARILADVAAKRAIVELHAPKDRRPWGIGNGWQECVVCFDPSTEAGEYTWETWPCPTLRALVQPYADHPDYNPDWRTS